MTFAPLPPGPFDIVYADPPWDYDNRVQHGGAGKGFTSGADAFYPTLKPEELKRLPVRSVVAKNALLFMWTTGPQLDISIGVAVAWGFKYKTVAFCWDKERVNPGAYTMSQHEFVLVCKRGSIPKPRGARNIRQLIREPRTKHSAKPIEARRRIDEMFPSPTIHKLELFARWPGDSRWVVWGNQTAGEAA